MTCCFCGEPVSRRTLNRHHLTPKSEGGTETAPAHKRCHVRHHSKLNQFAEWGRKGGETTATTNTRGSGGRSAMKTGRAPARSAEEQAKVDERVARLRHDPGFRFMVLSLEIDGEKPDLEKVAKMRRMLSEYPDLWRKMGDLARNCISELVKDQHKKNPSKQESILMACQNLRRKLGYGQAPSLEQMVIDEVVLAWARLYNVQELYNWVMNGQSNVIESDADFWDRRLEYSQKRYLRACASLARIKKLLRGVDVLQVNIAEAGSQQLNVAGDLGTAKAPAQGTRALPESGKTDK